MVTGPDSGSVLFTVTEHYANGNKKFTGQSSRVDGRVFEGKCTSYYPTGKEKEIANYKNDKIVGDMYNYYPNGKLYTYKQYPADKAAPKTIFNFNFTLITCNDSTGKPFVVDGNGYYIGYNDDFTAIEEEGNIKAGLRNGGWKGGYGSKSYKITFTESYDKGKLLQGLSNDAKGKNYKYTERGTMPYFDGGDESFGRFLRDNIKYPKKARENNVTGTVFLSFVVEKGGSLTAFEVLRNPGDGLASEALRVLKQSPLWMPGTMYGRPVRVQYTVPINFSLVE
ncbi:TonB family protein [Mucilaginibacter gracilis]|uniref:TonB family protein n=1 Tax=Mucilaginibacter gracilis TaxID=423350 RepID=A0A495IZ03_9SPHI|nr:energy transducer TonB [Mucilaginibacter gracilis]RKR81611.1 TonB family protein [Mucilaginibacter gracilis]